MNSKLQIISGQFRGRKLFLPPDARPTQNRARAALFNILSSGVIDAAGQSLRVWDAFAGSAAFGLEFLSRFPNSEIVFTDCANSSVAVIQKNIEILSAAARANVKKADALSVANKYAADADVIFLDPPYDCACLGDAIMRKISSAAKIGAIVIWEQEAINASQKFDNNWQVLRDKKYGRARFLILEKVSE